jgi:hypothetical protein
MIGQVEHWNEAIHYVSPCPCFCPILWKSHAQSFHFISFTISYSNWNLNFKLQIWVVLCPFFMYWVCITYTLFCLLSIYSFLLVTMLFELLVTQHGFLNVFFSFKMCLSFIEFDGFNFQYLGENLLRCTTHDEKGLILTTILFYFVFWSPYKIMNEKLSKSLKGLYFGLLQF